MSSMCSGCGTNIFSLQYMECSNVDCKKTYDLKCVAMLPTDFEALSQDYKDKWVCPECSCLKRKSDNTNTPIRGNAVSSLNATYTPTNFVNTQRGSRSKPEITDEGDNQLITEIKQFRLDVVARLDKQAEHIQQMLQLFFETKNEIREIDRKLRVLEEKVTINKQKPKSLVPIIEQNTCNQPLGLKPSSSPSSNNSSTYSSITQSNKSQAKRLKKVPSVATNVEATKNSVLPLGTNNLDEMNIDVQLDAGQSKAENEWKVVPSKKRKQKVMKGENTSFGIQALGKKKHLHVWRLLPETTLEQMEAHVKSICGADVCVTIEKIKHKTDRGYASFVVGVPERLFETINQTRVWPCDAEFSEWIWFRKSTRPEGK